MFGWSCRPTSIRLRCDCGACSSVDCWASQFKVYRASRLGSWRCLYLSQNRLLQAFRGPESPPRSIPSDESLLVRLPRIRSLLCRPGSDWPTAERNPRARTAHRSQQVLLVMDLSGFLSDCWAQCVQFKTCMKNSARRVESHCFCFLQIVLYLKGDKQQWMSGWISYPRQRCSPQRHYRPSSPLSTCKCSAPIPAPKGSSSDVRQGYRSLQRDCWVYLPVFHSRSLAPVEET